MFRIQDAAEPPARPTFDLDRLGSELGQPVWLALNGVAVGSEFSSSDVNPHHQDLATAISLDFELSDGSHCIVTTSRLRFALAGVLAAAAQLAKDDTLLSQPLYVPESIATTVLNFDGRPVEAVRLELGAYEAAAVSTPTGIRACVVRSRSPSDFPPLVPGGGVLRLR